MAARLTLTCDDAEFGARSIDGGFEVEGARFRVAAQPDGSYAVSPADGAKAATAWAVRDGDRVWVFYDGCVHTFDRQAPGWSAAAARRQDQLSAPMPASVRQVLVEPGQRINKGDTLVVLEAMKMELPIRAAADGTVRAVLCQLGDLVQPGVPLLDVEEAR